MRDRDNVCKLKLHLFPPFWNSITHTYHFSLKCYHQTGWSQKVTLNNLDGCTKTEMKNSSFTLSSAMKRDPIHRTTSAIKTKQIKEKKRKLIKNITNCCIKNNNNKKEKSKTKSKWEKNRYFSTLCLCLPAVHPPTHSNSNQKTHIKIFKKLTNLWMMLIIVDRNMNTIERLSRICVNFHNGRIQ